MWQIVIGEYGIRVYEYCTIILTLHRFKIFENQKAREKFGKM